MPADSSELHSPSPVPASKTRVLCVDDHDDFALLWSAIVDGEPDLTSAGTLAKADRLEAEVAARQATVVLLDLTMPGRDPFAAIADLRRTHPDVCVLAFSGYDDTATRERALRSGARALLAKSLEPDAVLRAIRAGISAASNEMRR